LAKLSGKVDCLERPVLRRGTLLQKDEEFAQYLTITGRNSCNSMTVFDTRITHGSVATRLRCGRMLSHCFAKCLLLSLSVKEFF